MIGVEVNDTQLRVAAAGYCASPVTDTPWPTYCVRPPRHQHPCMAVSATCPWCDETIRPDAKGDRTPVRPDGTLLHLACLYQRDTQTLNEAAAGGRIVTAVDPDEPAKWCPRCDMTRPVDEFNRNRSRPDGLHGYCKWCHRDTRPARRAS